CLPTEAQGADGLFFLGKRRSTVPSFSPPIRMNSDHARSPPPIPSPPPRASPSPVPVTRATIEEAPDGEAKRRRVEYGVAPPVSESPVSAPERSHAPPRDGDIGAASARRLSETSNGAADLPHFTSAAAVEEDVGALE